MPSTSALTCYSSLHLYKLQRFVLLQVEHLNLHEAQRRAREAGDPRPVADIMHRHTQQDYGWCRWACGCSAGLCTDAVVGSQ